MQGLVEAATKVADVLGIDRDDIYNDVRGVQKEHKAAANACVTVSPEMSESLAMADNANNGGRERLVVFGQQWSGYRDDDVPRWGDLHPHWRCGQGRHGDGS